MPNNYTPTTEQVMSLIRGRAVLDGATASEAIDAAKSWLASHDAEKRAEWKTEQDQPVTKPKLCTSAYCSPRDDQHVSSCPNWAKPMAEEQGELATAPFCGEKMQELDQVTENGRGR